jgi:hypothetical protein
MSDSLATSHRSLSAEERTSQMTSDAQDTYQASHNTRQPASAPMASQHSPASRPRYSQHHGFKKVVVADLGFCCERV